MRPPMAPCIPRFTGYCYKLSSYPTNMRYYCMKILGHIKCCVKIGCPACMSVFCVWGLRNSSSSPHVYTYSTIYHRHHRCHQTLTWRLPAHNQGAYSKNKTNKLSLIYLFSLCDLTQGWSVHWRTGLLHLKIHGSSSAINICVSNMGIMM